MNNAKYFYYFLNQYVKLTLFSIWVVTLFFTSAHETGVKLLLSTPTSY